MLMELSLFLAQLMGLSLAIFAVAGLLRPRLVRDAMNDFNANSLQSLFFGFVGIVVGLAIVLSHNIWEASWVGVVTLFGWLALLKGIATLVAPQALLDVGKVVYSSKSQTRVILFIALLVGLYIAYKGFGN